MTRFLAGSGDTLATTANEVLAKHVAATGGRQAWEAIDSLEIRLRIQGTSGTQMLFIRQYKQPLLFRQGIAGGLSAKVSDGQRVWQVRGDQWQEVRPDGTQNMASMDDYLIDPDQSGVAYTFIGVEVLNHAPVYHLQRQFLSGDVEELYFSIESGRLQERFNDYMSGASYFSYWNYREIGGVWLPHISLRSVGDFGPPHGVVIEEVLINPELPDELFLPPEQPKK